MDLIPEERRDEVRALDISIDFMLPVSFSSIIIGFSWTSKSFNQCIKTITMFVFSNVDLGWNTVQSNENIKISIDSNEFD